MLTITTWHISTFTYSATIVNTINTHVHDFISTNLTATKTAIFETKVYFKVKVHENCQGCNSKNLMVFFRIGKIKELIYGEFIDVVECIRS